MTVANYSKEIVKVYDTVTDHNQIKKWLHENPKTVDCALKALLPIGALCMIQPLVKRRVSPFSLTQFSVGGIMILAGLTSQPYIDEIAPPTHNHENHVFDVCILDDVNLAYEGNLPVLTINTKDPYKAGYLHGKMLSRQIAEIREINSGIFSKLACESFTKKYSDFFKEVIKQIPEKYIQEMQGIIDGYNGKYPQDKMTMEDLMLIHTFPDKAHIDFLESKGKMGGTVIVDGNEDTGPIIGRNLDLSAQHSLGKYTLLIRRNNTIELGLPGLVGTFTGMNSEGLSVVMNTCKGLTDEAEGLVPLIYNRQCLEENKTVEDVTLFTDENKPLGSYHLVVSDSQSAKAFHFFQNQEELFVREWNKSDPQITTNYRYHSSGKNSPLYQNSCRREEIIEELYQSVDIRKSFKERLQKILSIDFVNNVRTVHSIVMDSKSKQMTLTFDNGWAADLSREKFTIKC